MIKSQMKKKAEEFKKRSGGMYAPDLHVDSVSV